MAKILMVVGSTTGNTEYVAERVQRYLEQQGHHVSLQNAAQVNPEGLCTGWDGVLFGCSTWGEDSIELQDDFIPLFEAFDAINAKNVKTGVFGCGDSSYTYFCGAVDAIGERLEELGAAMIASGLKIDDDPATAHDDIDDWAKDIAKAF